MIGIDPRTGAEVIRTPDDSEPFSALAFKIAADPFVGKLASSGSTRARSRPARTSLNPTKGKRERIGRILQMHANHREEIDEVYAGDIAAAVGLKDTFTGDTLTDPEHPVILESMTFPEPVIEVKIEPKTKADQDKLAIALQRLAEEDPTFRVHTDPESSETLIAGMGELHLDVLVDRMIREFKVAANIGKPQVSYRETIRRAAEGNGRFVRQTGGKGQYGHAVIRLEPQEKGAGYEFVDKIVGGTIPREYIKSVDAGHPRGARDGHLRRASRSSTSRSPSSTGRTTRSTRPRWRSRSPVRWPSRTPSRKADPAILEPIMRVEVTMPEEFMGDVIGDLNSRRGQIEGMESRGIDPGRPGVRPARPDVRLRHGPAVDDPGSRDVVDGVQSLRRGPGQPGLGARPEVARSRRPSGQEPGAADDGQEEVRAHQAARQHRHDRPHRPRQDEPDRGDHEVPRPEGRRRSTAPSTRSTTRPRSASAGSRSRSPTSSTRPTPATTPTSTARATPTTSRT